MTSLRLWIAVAGMMGFATTTFADDEQWETFVATAYCSCTKCCGPNAQGITASGHRLKPGHRVVAVDRHVIPLGSVVEVQGLGKWAALDTGSAIKGNRIDIWMPSHQDALQYGRRTVRLRVLSRATRVGYDKPLPGHELWGALPASVKPHAGIAIPTAADSGVSDGPVLRQFAWTETGSGRSADREVPYTRNRRCTQPAPSAASFV